MADKVLPRIKVKNHRRGTITLPKIVDNRIAQGEGVQLRSFMDIEISSEFVALYKDDPHFKPFLMQGPYKGDGVEILAVNGKKCDHEDGLRALYAEAEIPSLRERLGD